MALRHMASLTSTQRLLANGVWPVMVTPFRKTGEIAWKGVDALVDWYATAGVAGIFTCCLSSEMYQLFFHRIVAIPLKAKMP